MEVMAEAGRRAYRSLVYETEGFIDYWTQATPLHELAKMPIGSRPARRKSGGFAAIRAIPWVFSWTQSRAIIPSWYGVGTGFDALNGESALVMLRLMYAKWPFFSALIDNAQLDLAKADMGIAELYAGLVAEDDLRTAIFSRIVEEHALAKHWVCLITAQADLLDNNPTIKRSIARRNPYVDPLNYIQVALLKHIRANGDDPALTEAVLATVNGIAAGMKTTG
jgi:phosphoenolpyruvate carboxylase